MRLSQRQWAELAGAGCVGYDYEPEPTDRDASDYGDFSRARASTRMRGPGYPAGDVGFFDAKDYAEIVNSKITQMDIDVQGAIRRNEPLGEQFNFNMWVVFTGNTAGQTTFDADAGFPQGWLQYYAQLGPLDYTLNKSATMTRIGRYELTYEDFRKKFQASGGETKAPGSEHPGTFATPADIAARQEGETDWTAYAKWGLVLVGIGVVGYTLTGIARVKGT